MLLIYSDMLAVGHAIYQNRYLVYKLQMVTLQLF